MSQTLSFHWLAARGDDRHLVQPWHGSSLYLSMIWFSIFLHCIDITEACELIKYFRLSRKGLNSLDEMKNKLREHLKGFERTSSPRIGELCNHSNTFSVQTSQIFVQSMVNYPTICNSFSSWEGSPPGWYVSSNCRELKRFYSAHDKGSTKRQFVIQFSQTIRKHGL